MGCNCCSGESHSHAGHHHGENQHREIVCQCVSFVMLAGGVIAGLADCRWFEGWLALLWYLAAFLPVGLPVVKEAFESVMAKDYFNEFMLMFLASVGAFSIGEYPEAVAVMLFYSVGESLQSKAVGKARRDIRALAGLRVAKALVEGKAGEVTEVDPSRVLIGDVVEVRPGAAVPLDGELLQECASFDTSALTGESVPREFQCGDVVLAGMIACDRKVRLRVVRVYSDSALSRMMKMVEEASSRKAPAELFLRRFSRIYTPVVVLLAALVVGLPYVWSLVASFDYVFSEWLYRGLVFLVISCPCALVVSVPLGYFGGIGAASRRGILFKGSNFLDVASRLRAVAFDKTGTLTVGELEVAAVEPADGFGAEQLLSYVASAEKGSNHPVAKAVVKRAELAGAVTCALDSLEELPGLGLKVEVGEKKVIVGNARLCRRYGVELPSSILQSAGTEIYCAVESRYAGRIVLSDTVREEVSEALDRLRRVGVSRMAVLSGDRQRLVDGMADGLGIDEAIGDLLPEDKVAQFKRFKKEQGGATAFVGDGINDAPVLALSDLGIAMGGAGTDLAVESADVVIASDNLMRLADMVVIGKATGRIVRQNVVLAIGVKVMVMALGIFGMANLWAAVFADVGVALLAIFNALRVTRLKF